MTDGHWRALNETLRRLPSLEVWDTFGRGCQWLGNREKSNLAAYVTGAVSKQKSRVEKVQMREWEEER